MTDKHDDLTELPAATRIHPEAFGRHGYVAGLGYTVAKVREIQQAAYSAGQRAAAVRAAEVCMEQAKEPECPERAAYCADAILREFGIDKEQGNG